MALPLLPQQHVLTGHLLQDHKAHVRQTVAPPIEVFPRGLIQVFVPDVTNVLTQSQVKHFIIWINKRSINRVDVMK